MATYRVLHVSDLHIAERARQISWPKAWRRPRRLLAGLWRGGRLARFASHDYGPFASLVDYVARHAAHLDAVLLTGDIATTGSAKDQQRAFELVAGRTPSFASCGVPLWIMPGNHDRFGGSPGAPAVSFAFDAHFGTYWSVRQGAQILGILRSQTSTVAFIGADFSFTTTQPTAGDYFGGGEVTPSVLASLEDLTDQVRAVAPNANVVWACHFAPTLNDSMPKEIAGAPRYLALEYGTALLASASRKGVHALLAGHLHNNSSYVSAGSTSITIAGSACQYLTSFGYWVHVLELDETPAGISTRVLDVRWDSNRSVWSATDYSRRL